MLAVSCSAKRARQALQELCFENKLYVACINSAESITLSGQSDAIAEAEQYFSENRIFARKLSTNGQAYHTKQMAHAERYYQELLGKIGLGSRRNTNPESIHIPMISSVTGQPVIPLEVSSSSYWCANLQSPVLFDDALQTLLQHHDCHIVELGPHPALKSYVIDTYHRVNSCGTEVIYLPLLVRNTNSSTALLELLGKIYLTGADLPFDKINRTTKQAWIDLPSYPWIYEDPSCSEPSISREFRNKKHPRHEILGSRILGFQTETVLWRSNIQLDTVPWLKDHIVDQTVVFPGAAYITMAVEAICQLSKVDSSTCTAVILRQVRVINALQFENGVKAVQLTTELQPRLPSDIIDQDCRSKNWWAFSISSSTNQLTTVHAKGLISLSTEPPADIHNLSRMIVSLEEQSPNLWYEKLASAGLRFGPAFRQITQTSSDRLRKACPSRSTSRLDSATKYNSTYFIHLATLDTLFQAGIITGARGVRDNLTAKIPVSIEYLEIRSALREVNSDVATAWTY